MNILILTVEIDWVYNLYEEYILSLKKFINKYYNNILIDILYYDIKAIKLNELNELNKLNLPDYNKIFYSGDIDVLYFIINKLDNNYKKIYFINIEQMSIPSYYTKMRNIDSSINIIDYSEENIPYFSNIYHNVFLFPPYFEKNNNNDKSIDILSIVNNEYRLNIIDSINYNILSLNECYNTKRNEYFSKTKIYINIHCSDQHNTMELIRLVNLIFNKVIIISQKSICSELLFLKDYIIICNDLNFIDEYISEILNNYEYYFNKIYNNFDEDKYYQYIKDNIDKIIYH